MRRYNRVYHHSWAIWESAVQGVAAKSLTMGGYRSHSSRVKTWYASVSTSMVLWQLLLGYWLTLRASPKPSLTTWPQPRASLHRRTGEATLSDLPANNKTNTTHTSSIRSAGLLHPASVLLLLCCVWALLLGTIARQEQYLGKTQAHHRSGITALSCADAAARLMTP